MITRRQLNLCLPAAFCLAQADPRAVAAPSNARIVPLADGMARLVRAYPDAIASATEHELVWHDGTRMPSRLYPPERTMEQQVAQPDLAAQVTQSYPAGHCALPVQPGSDPGRIRCQPFFAHMYGASEPEVERNLTLVRWPARRGHGEIRFTTINRAAFYLARVAEELAGMPKAFHRFFDNPAGGFFWRNIAGTNRLSGHAFGIAIDINVNQSDYWRNELHGAAGEPANWRAYRPRNRIPFEIVDIFERHGFIWGGKWYHYDTMHFEYRPELL